jgi:hypothetical protein
VVRLPEGKGTFSLSFLVIILGFLIINLLLALLDFLPNALSVGATLLYLEGAFLLPALFGRPDVLLTLFEE